MHIFRADPTNAGDWWSPPFRYFPFKPGKVFDILSWKDIPDIEEACIVGGGGLGREFFAQALASIQKIPRKGKLIAWGVGADILENRSGLVENPKTNLLGDYFRGFDKLGSRVWESNKAISWVPCASCMHPNFFHYRNQPIKKRVGIYQHKRVPIVLKNQGDSSFPVLDNSGDNIDEKLEFLSQFEYVITNTYHGVYWATLLNRKVICIPFKSGLYSFKHAPAYMKADLNGDILESAMTYPNALEECRLANIAFYNDVVSEYGDI